MADISIFHNPNCSTSKFALATAEELGVDVDVVKYLTAKDRPTADQLRTLVGQLEDPATDLVRRDANFAKLGLTDADVATGDQVVSVLAEHPELMQRPVIVRGNRAIIGRPKDRVADFIR